MAATGQSAKDSQADQVEVEMAFWCKIDNVRVVATVLSTLLNKKSPSQIAFVEVTPFVPLHSHCYGFVTQHHFILDVLCAVCLFLRCCHSFVGF